MGLFKPSAAKATQARDEAHDTVVGVWAARDPNVQVVATLPGMIVGGPADGEPEFRGDGYLVLANRTGWPDERPFSFELQWWVVVGVGGSPEGWSWSWLGADAFGAIVNDRTDVAFHYVPDGCRQVIQCRASTPELARGFVELVVRCRQGETMAVDWESRVRPDGGPLRPLNAD